MTPKKFHSLPEVLQNQLSGPHVVRVSISRPGADPLTFSAPVRLISPCWMEVLLPEDTSYSPFASFSESLTVLWERGENVVSLVGQLEAGLPKNWLRLKIIEVSLHPIKRRFPRVETELDLCFWPADMDRRTARLALSREVSISGCGIRFLAGDNCVVGQQLGLEIFFPETAWSPVHCVGKVVYRETAPAGGFWLALEIVSMTRTNLDTMMQFCIAEQFRQLQSKVNCLGSVLAPEGASNMEEDSG